MPYRLLFVLIDLLKQKVKQSHNTPMEVQGERLYSSYLFTTLALNGSERSATRPSRALPPGKRPLVPTGQEAGWATEPVWTQFRGKILLPLPWIEPRSPGRPVRSQTLYCLSYPGSLIRLVGVQLCVMRDSL
jgi:hypothetical protein